VELVELVGLVALAALAVQVACRPTSKSS